VYSFGIIIKAIGENIGDNTLLELGQQSSSAKRPSMILLMSALNPYTYTGNTLDKGQKEIKISKMIDYITYLQDIPTNDELNYLALDRVKY
jgi:hypothetical protein